MRALLVLAFLVGCTAIAARADALSKRPARGLIAPSPNGALVFVYCAEWSGNYSDPDTAAIQAQCRTSGLYARGAYAAPLWELHPRAEWPEVFASNDGAHVAVADRAKFAAAAAYAINDDREADPYAELRRRLLAVPAFELYARGQLVRTVPVGEVVRDAQETFRAEGVIARAEFGADGLFRVVSKDGNRTAWDPATGARVEGSGAPPEPHLSWAARNLPQFGVQHLVWVMFPLALLMMRNAVRRELRAVTPSA
jgi:hypothetical protein